MSSNSEKTQKTVKIVTKQFLRGDATDEHTLKSSLLFLGSLILVFFMCFILSITTAGASGIIRILVSCAIIGMVLIIYFNKGSAHGAEAVTRGEILWQKQEKGQDISDAERKICFHPMKAFLIGLIGTIPLILLAVIFSLMTQVQTTTAGTLPSWMQAYMRRDEVAAPLVSYLEPGAMGLTDILRHQTVYLIEKLSPLILLLPACAYGIGYLNGPKLRSKVHTAISENETKRKRREKKERRIRAGLTAKPKEPQKLN